MDGTPLTMRDVYLARRRIDGIARRTPLVHSPSLSKCAGGTILLKLENLQATGSFKIRGAANRMFMLSHEERSRGVITVSSGNHGRAVAFVAGQLGIRAVVCVSERVPISKVAAIRELGAEVVVYGEGYDQAAAHSDVLERQHGLTRVPPFDDPLIIAGQGTIGLELLEELPEIETVVVPLSGGGLIGGIGLVLKAADPAIHVIGV
jgi:threonine dehydratase